MILKPNQIVKRIIRAVGSKQSVLIIGDWQEALGKGIKENENSIFFAKDENLSNLEDNSFTRIVVDFNRDMPRHVSTLKNTRRLLLPTGKIIITAHSEIWFLEKIFNFIFQKRSSLDSSIEKIKPKFLQDVIHDNDFEIEAFNGYTDGHILMIAEIKKKEVSTLFTSERQETKVL